MLKTTIISVVPSPYQRDLFGALHARDEVDLRVFYLEDAAPDSPWGKAELESWEAVLPGFCFGKGRIRSHVNWRLPILREQDVVVVNTALTDVTTQRLLRRGRKMAPCAKWIFWGELVRTGQGVTEKIRRTCSAPLAKQDAIVAIGKRAQADYQARFPDQAVFDLPYHCAIQAFIDASNERTTGPSEEQGVCFLFCGQMIHRKGVDVLLIAFARLIESGSNAKLQLIGREADLPQFMEQVSDTVKQRIEFLGFQPVDELPASFAKADVFVLPSRHDGWGVVINQAIGAGLPIISTDRVGAAADLVESEANGIIVDAGNVDSLFDALKKLDANHRLVQKMSQANVEKRATLTPESGATKWVSILKEVRSIS